MEDKIDDPLNRSPFFNWFPNFRTFPYFVPFIYIFLILLCFWFLLNRTYGVLSPYRDSGDLVASAYSLGIAHPPGYGFYNLITKIGMQIFPIGNAAFRANFLSCLWTCLTVVILFKVLRGFVGNFASILTILIWFLSPSVFRLSIVSEMYSLNSLFCSGALYFALKKETKFFYLTFFLIGLGLTNHPTLIFLVPGLLIVHWFVLYKDREQFERFRSIFIFSLFAIFGFSLIIYYPVRSFQEPLIDWGNPETVRWLWRLITRSDYGGLKLHPEESHFYWTFKEFVVQIALFFRAELKELRWWGITFLGIGVFAILWQFFAIKFDKTKQKKFTTFWATEKNLTFSDFCIPGITFLVSGPFFFLLSNLPIEAETTLPILEPYLVMANLFALPFIAIGTEQLFYKLKTRRFLKYIAGMGLGFIIIIFSWPISHRTEFYAYDYGKNLMKTMPRHSSLYEPDDMTAFSLSYLQTVEHYRNDIIQLMTLKTLWGYEQLKKRNSEVVPPGDFQSAQEFIPALLSYQLKLHRAVFSDHSSKISSLPNFPVGLLSQIGEIPSSEDFLKRQQIFHFYVERGGKKDLAVDRHSEFFTRHLLSRVSSSLNNIGIVLQNQKQFQIAEQYFQYALVRQPSLTEAWNNRGVNFYLQGDYVKAEKIFQQGIKASGRSESLFYHLALTQRKLTKQNEAKKALQETLKLNPKHVGAINELGLIFLNEGDKIESQEQFEQCINIQPDFVPAYYNLGLVYREMGLKINASDSFKKYLELSPNAEDMKQVQKWIYDLKK